MKVDKNLCVGCGCCCNGTCKGMYCMGAISE